MSTALTVVAVAVIVVLIVLGLAVRIIKQYEQGVLFRFGRVQGARDPGLRLIIPVVDVMHRVSLRIVTMPIQSQGIITRDNVSVDVSAVAYFRVVDSVKSVVAIENVYGAGAQGHPAARQHEAGDGPPGRGRAGEARQDHQRPGRVAGRDGARRGLRHHDGPPAGAPAAQPAEPGGDRRGQEHHGVVFPAP